MQATFPIRRVSIQPFLIALALAAALICSAAGGYWLRSMTSQAAAVVTITRAVVQTSVAPVRSDSVRDLDLTGAAQSGRASDAIPASPGASGRRGRALE